jgi:prepilin-type processing-associated H-X9-DG protein
VLDSSAAPPGAAHWANWRTWIGYDNANCPDHAHCPDPYLNQYNQSPAYPAINPIHPGLIDTYLKDNGVKRCPSQPAKTQIIYAGNGFFPDPSHQFPTEFGPFTKKYNWIGDCQGAKSSDMEAPAMTLAMWEHLSWATMCDWIQGYTWWDVPPPGADAGHFEYFHFEGANMTWADGHSKKMRYGELRRWYFGCRKSAYPKYPG